MPAGWRRLKRSFPRKFCTFTGRHGGNHRALCTNGGSHYWAAPRRNNRILCARRGGSKRRKSRGGKTVSGYLRRKNGSKSGRYTFRVMKTSAKSGSYTNIMVNTCRKAGMKPVCDHRSYCRTDRRSIYIGQTHHMAHAPHRRARWMPAGWRRLKRSFPRKFCTFTGRHGGNHRALCTNGGSHYWAAPRRNNRILCARRGGSKRRKSRGGKTVSGYLRRKNGSKSGRYTFRVMKTSAKSGSYTNIMVNTCRKSACEVDASGLAKAEAKLPSQVLHLHRQAWWQSPSTLYERWKSLLGSTQKKQQDLVCQERRQAP